MMCVPQCGRVVMLSQLLLFSWYVAGTPHNGYPQGMPFLLLGGNPKVMLPRICPFANDTCHPCLYGRGLPLFFNSFVRSYTTSMTVYLNSQYQVILVITEREREVFNFSIPGLSLSSCCQGWHEKICTPWPPMAFHCFTCFHANWGCLCECTCEVTVSASL